MTLLIFILKTFNHRPVLGTLDYWLFGLTVSGVLFLIFRKKIVALIKMVIDKFKKKQTTVTPTTPDVES